MLVETIRDDLETKYRSSNRVYEMGTMGCHDLFRYVTRRIFGTVASNSDKNLDDLVTLDDIDSFSKRVPYKHTSKFNHDIS